MAYNLRNRSISRIISQEEPEFHEFGGNKSDEDEDCVDRMSNDSDDLDDSSDSDAAEAQNSSQRKRALNVRSRGRPITRLMGKNGYTWSLKPPSRTSDRFSRYTYIPGPANDAKNCNTIEEYFETLLTKEIRDLITHYTNIKIQTVVDSVMASGRILQTYQQRTDSMEINAFIGLLFYAGIWKANRVKVEDLWSNEEGYNIYRSTMPCRRFIFLAECLRFDDISNRQNPDRFSYIQEIWNMFIERCKINYNPHKLCTVDEQLLGFRGNCGFRVYIKSKPDRYGLKLVTLNDAKTFYLINAVPYTGKIQVEKGESIPSHVFQKVTEPIHGTNRSVTCDNWFTSIPLIEKMMKEPFNIRITGTIRSNKREIPLEMKIAGEIGTGKYCHHEDTVTLLSWTPKKNKVVLVASSYIRSNQNGDSGKPVIIEHYNSTKGGTDTFDQLCHRYTVARGTKRWPMRFFFGILDQAVVNSRILHTCAKLNTNKVDERLSSRECQKRIAHYLLRPFLQRRLQETANLRPGIVNSIKMILRKDEVQQCPDERPQFDKRVRCALCDRRKDHKTKNKCPSCGRAMCEDHRVYLCNDCGGVE